MLEIRQPQLGMRNGDRQRRQADGPDRRDRSNCAAGEQRSSRQQTELSNPLRQHADARQRRGATDTALLTQRSEALRKGTTELVALLEIQTLAHVASVFGLNPWCLMWISSPIGSFASTFKGVRLQ